MGSRENEDSHVLIHLEPSCFFLLSNLGPLQSHNSGQGGAIIPRQDGSSLSSRAAYEESDHREYH